MSSSPFGDTRGPTGNGIVEAFIERRATEAEFARRYTMDYAFVNRYHHIDEFDANGNIIARAGTVDVILKHRPGSNPIINVPIWGFGGNSWRFMFRPKGIVDFTEEEIENGTAEPDVGMLMFPSADSTRLLDNHAAKTPASKRVMRGTNPVFIPLVPTRVQTTPDNVVAGNGEIYQFGEDDLGAIMFNNGSGIIAKSNGRLTFRGAGFDFMDLDQTESDLANVQTTGVGDSTVMRSG